jgi:hypothetical protein
MIDTADAVATLVAEHHRNLTVEQRFQHATYVTRGQRP